MSSSCCQHQSQHLFLYPNAKYLVAVAVAAVAAVAVVVVVVAVAVAAVVAL